MRSSNSKENKKNYLTIEDIASMAGVAKSTVSRVLNNSGFVSEKTQKKVMEIVEAFQYIVESYLHSYYYQEQNALFVFTIIQMEILWQVTEIKNGHKR